ncbi:MAG: C40 family peptidase [Elusimicrobia bacterium]|nr:C40 family peptidase [Elusimicrobiota bacterium]
MKRNILFSIFLSCYITTCLYGDYLIRAGVFKDKASAMNLIVYLASHDYPASLYFKNNYKVIVGPYEEKEKAEFVISKLHFYENISASLMDESNVDKVMLSEMDLDISGEMLGELINFAFEFLGVNYKYGGMDPEQGIDCSFFMQTVYKSLGTILPRTSRLQFKIGKRIRKNELMPGDLVFFKKYLRGSRIHHVGMYIGNDEFIHASYGARKVTISSLNERYYSKRFVGARRPM